MSPDVLMAVAFWVLAVGLLIIFVSAMAAAFPRIRRKEKGQDIPGVMAADFLPGFALVALIILVPGGRGMDLNRLLLAAVLSWMTMYAAIRFGSLAQANPENRGPRKD